MLYPTGCIAIKPAKNSQNSDFSSEVSEFCRHIAGQQKIVATAQVDSYNFKPSNDRSISEIMVVIHNFQPRIMSYLKPIKNKTVFFFAVDQWIFERDVDRGMLGEALASKLIFPYIAFNGESYLRQMEVELKQRLISESLENLVINFPELVSRIRILPQYFLYEVISSRLRIFPLLAYDLSDLTSCLFQNEEHALESYKEALNHLKTQGYLTEQDGYYYITQKFIAKSQNPKLRIINLSKNAPRTLFTSLFGVLPQLMSIVTQNAEAFLRTQKINWLRQPNQTCRFIDPQRYLFFPTAEGYVSLSEKIDIKGFTQRLLLKDQTINVEVEHVGGMLNDVYLINAGDRKVLAKRFKDWSGFKWFPLSLWSFGARSFAVSGQARLAKECAISELLSNAGFNVPKILLVSNTERLVFMEFIEGASLSQAIKQYASDEAGDEVLATVAKVGETLAKVHAKGVSLGDTKPDNVLVKADGTLYLIDFEQAQQGGDKAWDIAVFLYYCGHYLQPFDGNIKASSLAVAFIEGYLKAGGNVSDIHKAARPKYTRVFSIFTMPSIMLAISNVCKQAQNQTS
ncbi:MAG: phosphotransferase [Candidatus Bathyarchaeota archaeon]|nr:phosphotransferase [Candidatus Bathyarchaeota archaeon]